MNVQGIALGEYQANCYVVTVGDVGLVIDPGEENPELLELIGDTKVVYILNTHCHPDHIGGDEFVRKHCGAKLLFHPHDQPIFEHFMSDKIKPDGYLAEGQTIKLNSLIFEVLHTPGHSPGSVVFKIDSEGALFSGDVLFAGSIGRTDFPGGDPQQMARSLKRLLELPGDYTLYPGHGPVTKLSIERWTNPFLQGLDNLVGEL